MNEFYGDMKTNFRSIIGFTVTYLIIMVQLNDEELEDQILWKTVSQ